MEQQVKTAFDSFKEMARKIRAFQEAIGLMAWDMRTGAPRKGAEERSEAIGMISGEAFKLMTSKEMGDVLDELSKPEAFEQLDDVSQRMVKVSKKDYDEYKKIPADLYQRMTALSAHAQTIWEEAKKNSDFSLLEPSLTKIVDYLKQYIGYLDKKDTPYDTLIDRYEPDMTVKQLDQVFSKLRNRLVPLAEAIAASGVKPDTSFLDQLYDKEQQEKFGLYILKEMGYDFEAGRQDESEHPFAIGLNSGDVRITTHYLQDDVTSALFSSLHEGGHALYEQNIDKSLAGTPLAQGTSMGIHESQSRLWENMIGRSRAFWDQYYSKLQQYFPQQLQDVDVETFHRAVNRVENSLIRIESDELTYNLHIIIRYEIEKMLFNEGLEVKDLPKVWNEKYEQYLGITPPNDGVGVLQDVHWSGGDFGYFASYSLGNMYAAQMMHTMRKELPQLDKWVAEGNLLPIKEWLNEKVHRYGKSRTPSEIIMEVTGEELNPDYLADYLEQKYKDIYNL